MRITDTIEIDDSELIETFVRASGPGGQNVNKVSTAVELRFNVQNSPNIPTGVKARLKRLAGRRLTSDGVIVISANRHRTQALNRADARERLADLIKLAAVPPKPRRPTKPTLASKLRRVESKKRRSQIKRNRRVRPDTD